MNFYCFYIGFFNSKCWKNETVYEAVIQCFHSALNHDSYLELPINHSTSKAFSLHGRKISNFLCVVCFSHVRLFSTPWIVAHQAPLSIEFSRQEHWSGQSFPSPGDLPNLGIKPGSPASQANSLPSEPPGKLFSIRDLFYLVVFPFLGDS